MPENHLFSNENYVMVKVISMSQALHHEHAGACFATATTFSPANEKTWFTILCLKTTFCKLSAIKVMVKVKVKCHEDATNCIGIYTTCTNAENNKNSIKVMQRNLKMWRSCQGHFKVKVWNAYFTFIIVYLEARGHQWLIWMIILKHGLSTRWNKANFGYGRGEMINPHYFKMPKGDTMSPGSFWLCVTQSL